MLTAAHSCTFRQGGNSPPSNGVFDGGQIFHKCTEAEGANLAYILWLIYINQVIAHAGQMQTSEMCFYCMNRIIVTQHSFHKMFSDYQQSCDF